jgi:membrane protein implicated in regulation of membrane protease activity
MPFLYFPEDKTEYLPAIITLIIFTVLAVVAVYLFIKKSKKDEQKFNEKYGQRIKEAEDQNN